MYLRPGECDSLTKGQIIRPCLLSGDRYQRWGVLLHPSELLRASKAQAFDESLVLDSFAYIGPCLGALAASGWPLERLWTHPPNSLKDVFLSACLELKLNVLAPCLYALRHGGASEDLLSHQRSISDVKARGRWASDSSLRRYSKATRLLSELTKVHPDVLAYGDQVLALLPRLFLEAALVPPPPRLPP